MAKFYGAIGFGQTIEEPSGSGVYKEHFIEFSYYGDILRDNRRWTKGEGVNDNLVVNNQFSVLADAFAFENFQGMRYVRWMGAIWKITSVEIQRPRIILTVGEVFNAV